MIGDTQDRLNALVTSLHDGDENFVLQDKGLIGKYLGVDIAQVDGTFQLTQPFLIKRITQLLRINQGKTNEKLTPVGKPLHIYKRFK